MSTIIRNVIIVLIRSNYMMYLKKFVHSLEHLCVLQGVRVGPVLGGSDPSPSLDIGVPVVQYIAFNT